jgi:alpha-N-arabinofuranosidase
LHDKQLVLTVVNPDVKVGREAQIAVRGASLQSGSATTLTHSDLHAHNTFEQRNVVAPQNKAVEAKGRTLTYTFPPASVTKLSLSLA